MSKTQIGQTDLSVANAKHDSYSVMVDVNHLPLSRVFFGIVK